MNDLVAQIDSTDGPSPALWWLGHAGFAVKHSGIAACEGGDSEEHG
jgi:hypothetical protein